MSPSECGNLSLALPVACDGVEGNAVFDTLNGVAECHRPWIETGSDFAQSPLDIIGPLLFGSIVPHPVRLEERIQERALAEFGVMNRMLLPAGVSALSSCGFHTQVLRSCAPCSTAED
jgi:hypothetical protein